MNDSLLSAVLIAVGVLVAIGLICALILVIAAKFFAVKVDEKEQKIRACLPGANCGACGFTGCDGYAKALAEGSAPANLCVPGGASAAAQLGEVLGVSVEAAARMVALQRHLRQYQAEVRLQGYPHMRRCKAVLRRRRSMFLRMPWLRRLREGLPQRRYLQQQRRCLR